MPQRKASKEEAQHKVPKEVLAAIEEAIKKTVLRMIAEKNASPFDCYKQTIKRIKAVPILQERIADNMARLESPIQEKSKSIIRFTAAGVRADPEEMLEAIEMTLRAHIAADQAEVDEIMKVLSTIEHDYYYPVVYEAFIQGKTDEALSQQLACDVSTVRRNRKRLVNILSVRLYGALAE